MSDKIIWMVTKDGLGKYHTKIRCGDVGPYWPYVGMDDTFDSFEKAKASLETIKKEIEKHEMERRETVVLEIEGI